MTNIDGIPNQVIASKYEQVLTELRLVSEIDHPGESGRARENILRQFIRSITPGRFGVDTGFVFDASGAVSRQVDIVIYRTEYHPLFDIGGIKHFMVESVVAVFEVKARVDSRAVLDSALENIASVKRLDMSGGGTNYMIVPDMHLISGYQQPFEYEVFGGILAECALNGGNALRQIHERIRPAPRSEWPNMMAVLDDYVIRYIAPNGNVSEDPWHAVGISLSRFQGEVPPPLIDFAMALANRLRVSQIVDFNPSNYFGLNKDIHDAVQLNDASHPPLPTLPSLPDSRYHRD
jgi:hypothetical protein